MNADRYREAYGHYQRQIEKRWPDAVIAPEWDDLGGDMQDCWRAGLDAFDGYLDGVSHLERAEKAEARVAELERELFALDDRTRMAEDAKDIYDDVRDTVARLVVAPSVGEERNDG